MKGWVSAALLAAAFACGCQGVSRPFAASASDAKFVFGNTWQMKSDFDAPAGETAAPDTGK